MSLAQHYGNEPTLHEARQQFEADYIRSHLEVCDWNQIKAARSLGISRRSLVYKIEKYGLKP